MNDQTTIGQAAAAGALPFVEAKKAGHLLFISGQIGVETEFGQEVRHVMENIGRVLQGHGLGYSHLVNVTIYLTDMASYGEMNKVYSEFFRDGFPTRVCIAVKELAMHARIEISAIASLS